ncbi:hypothetical protein LaLC_57710 [Bacillus anthracis]|uniref:Uncharacterized protein n=1 Tax=Bacillus anthracis TaxID=1392 RepID=A0A640MMD4_BACAN|nr:hypothetical protein LaLC_57710 [Bacillus anthracis]
MNLLSLLELGHSSSPVLRHQLLRPPAFLILQLADDISWGFSVSIIM